MRPPVLRVHLDGLIVDSFAGGGGASEGITWALGRSPDIAVNHDPEAIAMHRINHPGTRHYCEDVRKVDPKRACAGRRVALAWFSPDCKHFSKCKGGKPVDDNVRGLAWVVIDWAEATKPDVIFLENVEEFANWGPLTGRGLPDPLQQGLTFRRWVGRLRALGYVVEWRELRAHDYGAPTIRKRLFVIARRDGKPIVWPEAEFGPALLPYRTAAECIDWSIPCPSIFLTRKQGTTAGVRRPLATKTLRRIARGTWRFVIDTPEPFIIPVTHAGDLRSHSVLKPFRTVTGAHRGEQALVTPFIAPVKSWGGGGNDARSIDEPMRTVTTSKRGEHALIAPTLIQTGYGERPGQTPRSLDLHAPLGTVVAGGAKHALVAAFLAKHYGGHEATGSEMHDPVATVKARDSHSLVTSHLMKLYGTAKDGRPVTEPMPTITTGGNRGGGHIAEVRAFLLKYYGAGSLAEPAHTVTTRDRFALVTVHGVDYVIADIGMRMLTPRELFRAQGFEDDYVIDFEYEGKPLTKTAQIRMAGNSVCPPLAARIIQANFRAEAAIEVAS